MPVTVAGIPAGARHGRRRQVLRAHPPPTLGPVPLPRDAHQGHRQAIWDTMHRRRGDRDVWGYQLHGRWHAAVHDGNGLLLVHLTPDGVDDVATAVRVMDAAAAWLRVHADPHRDRWDILW